MEKIVRLTLCLLFATIQTLSLTVSAHIPNIPPSLDANGLTKAASITSINSVNRIMGQTISSGFITSIGTAANNKEMAALDIEKGNVVLSPDKDIRVGIDSANIYLKAGATIFVMKSAQNTIIYDLYQTNSKQVIVFINKGAFSMQPGQMLVLSKQNANNFESLENTCHLIDYRKAAELPLNESEIKGFSAQFSILSAIRKIEPLQRLLASNDKTDRVFLSKILKMAATLENIN